MRCFCSRGSKYSPRLQVGPAQQTIATSSLRTAFDACTHARVSSSRALVHLLAGARPWAVLLAGPALRGSGRRRHSAAARGRQACLHRPQRVPAINGFSVDGMAR